MIGAERDREMEDGESEEIEIVDKRHQRNLDVEEVAEAEAPADSGPAPETEPQDLDVKHYDAAPAREAPGDGVQQEPDYASMTPEELEMHQLKQVFAGGLTGYLVGHINFLLNFAVIYLGRAPNPGTGLVSPDLEKAKTAIDLLETIYQHVQKELQPQERSSIERILADLKLGYMQALTEVAPPPGKPSNGN